MNFACRQVGQFIVGAHNKIHPTQAEWGTLLEVIRRSPVVIVGTMVFTVGGAPSALQRKQYRDALIQKNSEKQLSAILTDSIIARTAITALNLFLGGRLQAFPLDATDAAFVYIKAPSTLWPALTIALNDVKKLSDPQAR